MTHKNNQINHITKLLAIPYTIRIASSFILTFNTLTIKFINQLDTLQKQSLL